MTIETSPAANLFAGFNDEEKKMIAVAVRRVEELEETRRIMAGMAGQARGIEADLKARGVTDADVLREASEAVEATMSVKGQLASEVHDYRKLFGPDGRASSAVGQYAQLLRKAHVGDVEALNRVQSARRELYEARDASAQHRETDTDATNAIEMSDPERVRRINLPKQEVTEERKDDRDNAMMRQTVSTALPASFTGKYVKNGNKLVEIEDPSHVLLVDKGSKLEAAPEFDAESVKAMVDIGEARGWKSMNVTGKEEFRRAVYMQAASRGIEVKGYTPTEAEKAWVNRELEKQGKTNTVSENSAVKAFREAESPAERRKAAEKHPELKKAFALEAAYSTLSKQITPKSSQNAFMARMRENIALDLAQGRELADVRLRKPMVTGREYNRAQDRVQDHDRGR